MVSRRELKLLIERRSQIKSEWQYFENEAKRSLLRREIDKYKEYKKIANEKYRELRRIEEELRALRW